MPWQLTAAVSTGDLAASDYAQVRIVRMVHDSVRKHISLFLEYGNTVDDEWVTGHTPPGKDSLVTIDGDDYNTLVTTHATNDGELTYMASKRGLYEWLSDNGKIDAGSIV